MHWASVFAVASWDCCTWIVQERLEREYGSKSHHNKSVCGVQSKDQSGGRVDITSPSKLPAPQEISEILEPIAKVVLHARKPTLVP